MVERVERARWEHGALVVLGLFTVVSTVGYGFFALRPENLPATGLALALYSVSYELFAQAHILTAFAVLAFLLVSRLGWRWLVALALVYVLSFTSEHVGTGYGIPFGGYAYSGLLGVRVGPRVPALIPLSWFLMALPAWCLARAVAPDRMVLRLALGSWGLVLWDLALDPAMSFLTPYWRWEETGPYYGMPWSNLLGWFATGGVLMLALDLVSDRLRLDALPTRWMAVFYGLVLSLPLGMLAVAGAWTAVVVTLTALLATIGAARLLGPTPQKSPALSTRPVTAS